jgi:hypothetical protein
MSYLEHDTGQKRSGLSRDISMLLNHRWLRPCFTFALPALAACAKAPLPAPLPTTPKTPDSLLYPVASIVGLMSAEISPSANALWESVATVSGPKGSEEKAPHTDKEWAEVRSQALILSEASNLLMLEGRHVLLPGEKFANPPGAGDLTPEKAEAAIAAARPSFNAFAKSLQEAGIAALKTIDARDATALMESGGAIDEACEACHKKFWYPDGGAPAQ